MTQQVLVLQHPNLPACALPKTAAAFRLPESRAGRPLRVPVPDGTAVPAAVAAELDAQQVDFAVLDDIPFADIGLIASDMDSTLITVECIDEIAAAAGLRAQVAAVTERAMRGEIDFAQSLHSRVALLEGLPESVLETVYRDALRLSPGAETLLAECQKHGVRFLLVSGGFTFCTDRLRTRLGIDWAHANVLESEGGRLTGRVSGGIVDAQAKADLLEHYRNRLAKKPWRWATAPTISRCCARPDSARPTMPNRPCAAAPICASTITGWTRCAAGSAERRQCRRQKKAA